LHSFPTRRSSDLIRVPARVLARALVRALVPPWVPLGGLQPEAARIQQALVARAVLWQRARVFGRAERFASVRVPKYGASTQRVPRRLVPNDLRRGATGY